MCDMWRRYVREGGREMNKQICLDSIMIYDGGDGIFFQGVESFPSVCNKFFERKTGESFIQIFLYFIIL